MRVLHVVAKHEWGGIATWMELSSIGLRERGHEVWYAAQYDGSVPTQTRNPEWVIPMHFGHTFSFKTVSNLRTIIQEKSIDVVVVNSAREMAMGGYAARKMDKPIVRSMGMAHDVYRKPRYLRLHRKYADFSIVPGENMRQEIIRNAPGIDPASLITVYNGREPTVAEQDEIANLRTELGIDPDDIAIGCFARFHAVKGQVGLVKVFSEVLKTHPKTRLVLAGEGDMEGEIRQTIADLGVGDRVNLPGFLSPLIPYVAACDVHVLNSGEEGFANGIVEAMAYGKPVVATNVGGADEIIKQGENGFLYEPQDRLSCKSHLQAILEDEHFRLELGKNARRTVNENFTLENMIDGVESVFERAIGMKR